MSSLATAWRFPLVACLLLAGVIGYMLYDGQAAAEEIAGLQKQVNSLSTRVNTLRSRAARLEAGRPERELLVSRLVSAGAEAYSSQLLMGVTAAGRKAGVTVGRLTFTGASDVGGVKAVSLAGSVTGTEAQLAAFFAALEQGRPVGQVEKLNWSLQVSRAPGTGTGSAAFQLLLFGPVK